MSILCILMHTVYIGQSRGFDFWQKFYVRRLSIFVFTLSFSGGGEVWFTCASLHLPDV